MGAAINGVSFLGRPRDLPLGFWDLLEDPFGRPLDLEDGCGPSESKAADWVDDLGGLPLRFEDVDSNAPPFEAAATADVGVA